MTMVMFVILVQFGGYYAQILGGVLSLGHSANTSYGRKLFFNGFIRLFKESLILH